MDRRDFLGTGAVSTAGMLFFPGNLLASEAKIDNQTRLVQPLRYKRDGEYFKVDIAKARRIVDNIIQPRVVTNTKILRSMT